MSDISIVFPRWMLAWIWLGEAVPFTTLVMVGLGAAFLLGRRRARLRRWLTWPVAILPALVAGIVSAAWIAGIGFWAAGLADRPGHMREEIEIQRFNTLSDHENPAWWTFSSTMFRS